MWTEDDWFSKKIITQCSITKKEYKLGPLLPCPIAPMHMSWAMPTQGKQPLFGCFLIKTPIFKWYVVGQCDSKNGHQKHIMCLIEVINYTACSRCANHSKHNSQHNWEDYMTNLIIIHYDNELQKQDIHMNSKNYEKNFYCSIWIC